MFLEQLKAYYPVRYVSHPFYQVIALLCLALGLLFAWEMVRAFSLGNLFFCLLCLGLGLWNLGLVGSRVEVETSGLCVVRLGRGRQCVEFRQLVSVSESGRLNPVITLVYHPSLSSGLLDLDAVQSLVLPAVRAQADLLAHLQARMPV